MVDKKILRVVDANINRAKEGLRVVEDIFRFVLISDYQRKKVRFVRHNLDKILKEKIVKQAITTRDSIKDRGKDTDHLELKRKDYFDIIYANLQRAKESMRVLEECFKIVLPKRVSSIKKLRYELYTIEKNIILKWPSVRNRR